MLRRSAPWRATSPAPSRGAGAGVCRRSSRRSSAWSGDSRMAYYRVPAAREPSYLESEAASPRW
jgi:hypothetical protein